MLDDTRLKRNLNQLILENGIGDVVKALFYWCDENGYEIVARRIQHAYDWFPLKAWKEG